MKIQGVASYIFICYMYIQVCFIICICIRIFVVFLCHTHYVDFSIMYIQFATLAWMSAAMEAFKLLSLAFC